MTNVTVGIPAYNEGASIEHTLQSVLDQDFAGGLEILVCSNGSNDNTEDKVRALSQSNNNIRLVSTEKRSKPRAWNLIRSMASNKYIFFLDGDVYADRGAISSMAKTLESSQLAAVAGTSIPSSENGLLAKMMELPFSPQQILIGRIYGINNQKVSRALEAVGLSEMPEDILLEDAWLSLMIGRGNFTLDQGAIAHYHPYRFKDRLKIHKRNMRGVLQLRNGYPVQLDNFMRDSKRFGEGVAWENLLGYLVRRAFNVAAVISLIGEKLDSPLDGWEVARSTKKPLYKWTL